MRSTIDDRDIVINQGGKRGGFVGGRAILALAGACFVLVLVVVLVQQLRATFDPLERQAQQEALYRTQQLDSDLYTVDMVAGAVLRLVLPVGLAFALLGVVIVALVLVYQRWAAPVAVQAFYHVEGLKAQYQIPVPHSLTQTYTPHHSKSDSLALPPPVALDAPLALPGVVDLATLQHKPTPQSVLLGLDENNQRVTVPLNALLHVASAGATGAGKSNIQRLLLAQLLALGAKVAIGDPKWTPYDAEQDEDWRPIEKRLHLAPAVSANEIGGLLDYTHGEMMKRLEQRRKGEKISTPLFICLDELPWIADNVKGSADQIGELVRLGRGVKVFTIAAAQDWLAKTVGMSSARDNFRTALYLGGDLKTGAVLLDMPQRELSSIEGGLSLGVALVRSQATTPAKFVRIPYASNQALYTMLGDNHAAPVEDGAIEGAAVGAVVGAAAQPFGFRSAPAAPTMDTMGSMHHSAVKPLSVKAVQVRELLREKAGTDEIIRRVWQVERSTRAGRKAYEELQDILAELAG